MLDKNQYWQERSEKRILSAEKTAGEMVKDLKKLYLDTVAKINKEVEAFIGKYSTDTGLSIEDVHKLLDKDELKQFRYEVKRFYEDVLKHPYDPAYRNRLKNAIYQTTTKADRKLYSLKRRITRLDSLKVQMEHAVEKLYMQQNQIFESNLSNTYKETYMQAVFDTQQATGAFQSFTSLNGSIINKAIQQKWIGSNYSERIWNDKNKLIDTLENTFLQDIAIGKSPKAMASDFKKITGVKYKNCERLARTEFNHIANEATYDSYKETKGLDRYKYEATLDSRTSKICQRLDQKVFLMKEKEIGVNYPPMHPNCFDKETEIYTKDGWKLVTDCNDNDLYLSINPETMQPEWLKAIQRISYNFVGNIIEFTNTNFNLRVTPNHQMLVKYIKKDGNGKLRFVEAEKLPKYNNSIPRGLNWIGKNVETIKLGNYDIPTESYLKFMAWYLSDGSCTRVTNKNSYKASIAQETHHKLMFDELSKLPFAIRETKDKIYFTDKSVCEELVKYGKCNKKYIPEIIKELTPDLIKVFLLAYSIADGHKKECKNWKNGSFEPEYMFFTSSKRLADDIGELILKAGGRPSFNLQKNKGKSVKFKNGEYTCNFDVWNIRYCHNTWASVESLQRNLIPYDDMVYCVELPKYHTLLVRRNGKVCWAGNCRSTTIPYLDDLNADKIERLATDPQTGKAYYIDGNMSFSDWKRSLTETQGKYLIANQKMNLQYKSDIRQLREYKKLALQANKQGKGELFEGLPKNVKEWQKIKYLEPEKYNTFKHNRRILIEKD